MGAGGGGGLVLRWAGTSEKCSTSTSETKGPFWDDSVQDPTSGTPLQKGFLVLIDCGGTRKGTVDTAPVTTAPCCRKAEHRPPGTC